MATVKKKYATARNAKAQFLHYARQQSVVDGKCVWFVEKSQQSQVFRDNVAYIGIRSWTKDLQANKYQVCSDFGIKDMEFRNVEAATNAWTGLCNGRVVIL